jgi:AcrR family transcriptional regulator
VTGVERKARDQRIVEAAERLFFERSFDGVGVDEIGKAAGISGSAIYRYFESKDEILAVMFDRAVDSLLLRVPAHRDDAQAQLDDLVQAHVGFAQANPRLAAIWAKEQHCLAEPYRRAHRRRQQSYLKIWTTCMSRCYPHRSAEDILLAVLGVHALLMAHATSSSSRIPSARAGRLLADIALAGLKSLSADAAPAPSRSNGELRSTSR